MMKSIKESEQPIISNNFIKCYSDHLVIDLYYFPFGNKTIKYKDIQSCELNKLSDLSMFKYKTWGMALSSIWWHSDLRRFTREYYILLDTNQSPKIGITMDDRDIIDVYKFIIQKINHNQTNEKKSYDSIGKSDANMVTPMLEKELEYQKNLESNKMKYTN